MSYFSKFQQNVVVSAGNSSSANLNGGDTFTGTSQTTLGVAGIQVNLKADQNCRVYVDQSINGTDWDITDQFNYFHSYGGNSWTVQATASYCRVRVTNLNATIATTVLRLQTAMCPIVESLPRALNQSGYLKTAIQELYGDFDLYAIVDQTRGLKTVSPVRLSGSTFYSVLEPNLWSSSLVGSGTAVVSNGVLTMETGGTSASNSKVYSVRTARFIFGSVNYIRSVMFAPAVTGANTRRWGAMTALNGFFFQQDNVNGFSVGYRKGGIDYLTSTGSFLGEIGSTYTLDANLHSFEIFWLASGVYYFIDGSRLHYTAPTATSLVNNMDFTVGFENVNGANTNNNQLLSLGASIYRLGGGLHVPRYTNINTNTTTVIKQSSGNLHSVSLNKPAGENGVLTVYDNSSAVAPIMAVCETSGSDPYSFDFKGVQFNNGLTVVTASSETPANITVLWE